MHNDLLPGVTTSAIPPSIVCDAKAEIRRARRRAVARDAAQVLLLIAVDYLFVHWPATHVPTLDREASLSILRVLNLTVLAHLWLERAVPRWAARRIASTWCRNEQSRFFTER